MAHSETRLIDMPDGSSKLVTYDDRRKFIVIGAGGFGECPGCELSIRLEDPRNPREGEGLSFCPVCKTTFHMIVQR